MWQAVHVITRLELGGAQLATLHEVQRSGFAAGGRALLFGPGGMLDGEARQLPEVEARAIPLLARDLAPLADLRALVALTVELYRLKRERPGARLLVHTHSSKAGILGRWAAFLAGADLIVHSVHGFGHRHHGPLPVRALLGLAERLTGRITDAFTADSAANVHQGRSEGLFGDAPAQVVRCGIDVAAHARPARAGAEVRRQLGIPEGHGVVLNVSCLKPQKDPLAYVELAAQVIAARPTTVFLLAGDGELRPRIERAAERLGLGEAFRLLGWRRDVPELLAASDLLVLTSRWEGLPQVLPQAMAAGLPVVATRVDGAPEAVEPGESGLLYAPGDIEAMARGVLELLADPQRRALMGARGRERAELFDRDKMVRDLDAFYADVAARKGF